MASAAHRIVNWAAAFEDGAIIRAAFFGLLSATAVILYIDYTELSANTPEALPSQLAPILPAFDPSAPGSAPGPEVSTPTEVLRQPLEIKLGSGGELTVTGTIMPGSASTFAAQVGSFAEYIKTVALDSPGGSVVDALEIGRLIREKGFATSVAAGSLCASSCPLVFAGGKERIAAPDAAIAVHQIYAATPSDATMVSRLAAAGNA
ncbi:MAG: ATP-dependent Clp protease proteolytic subunit, partial [Devosia sp.]